MPIETWWPLLEQGTRDWLVANNGDLVPAPVLAEITRVAGPVTPETPWLGDDDPNGCYLSDTAIDWIEEFANDEAP